MICGMMPMVCISRERGDELDLSELTAYAKEKYHIEAQHKKLHTPGASVLKHPKSGLWVVMMTRVTDPKTGREIQHCDIKCGRKWLNETSPAYLTEPFHMKNKYWVGVVFDERTNREFVCRLLDEAMQEADIGRYYRGGGYTVVLEEKKGEREEGVFHDTALPAPSERAGRVQRVVPEKISEMMKLYKFGRESFKDKCKNFVRQAKFMAEYEDDAPWNGEFKHYFCTYHDLTVEQLRGYFTWRTRVRRGEYTRTAASFAYMYIYELLNGIGVVSPEDALEKMMAFKTGYVDGGMGDKRMETNLYGWMLDFAIVHGMSPETARQYADPKQLMKDACIETLVQPQGRSDDEVFVALARFASKKLLKSPVLTEDVVRGRHLFAELWRKISEGTGGVEPYITSWPTTYPWHPLANAVYLPPKRMSDITCVLSESRTYCCQNGSWHIIDRDFKVSTWELERLLSEADSRFRAYLKHDTKAREVNAGIAPYVEAVIEEDKRIQREAAKQKIRIDMSGLDQIRRDAIATQNSLLTEDEKQALHEAVADEEAQSTSTVSASDGESGELAHDDANADDKPISAISLDPVQRQILTSLLRGEAVKDLIKKHHLMASIVTDSLNEALFDEIGDNVLECENDVISVIDDYREDIIRILGGI